MNFTRKTKIMAILNMTPDSFSDGGRLRSLDAALRAAEHALAAGADILDIGGESTRPGADTIDPQDEIDRVIPVFTAIRREFPHSTLSIDTRKATVAQAAVEAGASMINDVSGLQYDAAMADVAARYGTQLVITHSQGTPETMQKNPQYPQGVVTEVAQFMARQVQLALGSGVKREQLILDPGLGFGKTLTHNLVLLRQLDALHRLELPLLVGASRKSFLTLGNREIEVDEREALTAVAISMAIQKGAAFVRVHDVETQLPVVRLVEALLTNEMESLSTPRPAGALA